MKKHSVTIAGHLTSITLEDEFWQAFRQIASDKNKSLNQLVTEIDRKRVEGQNLSSAIRVYVLGVLQSDD